MFITKKDGTIPSEAEGMSMMIDFLGNDDHWMDDIVEETEGVYILSPSSMKCVFYNSKTGEFGLANQKQSCNYIYQCNSDICHQGCGCNCWIDRGWRNSTVSQADSINIHCKDTHTD